MAEISVGNIVRIIKPYQDETSGIDLAGSKGVVRLYFNADTEEDQDQIMIEWTPETLDKLPDVFFLNSFENEVSWTTYLLPIDAVELQEGRVNEKELAWKKQEKFTAFFLPQLGRESKIIIKPFEKAVDPQKVTPQQCWFDFLQATVRFPVKCKACYPYEEGDGPLKEGQRILLKSLNSIDNNLGILADVESDEREYVIPLMDLTGDGSFSKDGRYLDSYGLWTVCIA